MLAASILSGWLYFAMALQATADSPAATESRTPARAPSLVAAAASGVATQESPIAASANGLLSGKIEDGVAVFRGIPFAAPPLGELRWREPQPVASWEGVRNADQNCNSCIQPKASGLSMGGLGAVSEDCLYLNVWTPGIDPGAKRPVMVWIHGGALTIGAGSLDLYNGTPLAKRGAVVVTVNYRLGALGFFSHPALEKQSPRGPVNFGLLDQVAALQWVQKNIAAFGGDPENVTIAGESAGAQSVLALLASPLTRGLFNKAIAESPYGIPSHTRAQALRTGINIATALGFQGASATAEQLRAAPAKDFVQLKGKSLSLAPSLIVGDAVMPVPFLDAFEKCEEAPVPLIIGSNSDEASVATAFGIDPDRVIKSMGVAGVVLKRLYPEVKNNRELGREVIRDLIFATFVRRIADLHSGRSPTWRYYFSYVPLDLRVVQPGVPHGGEIVFTLGTADFDPSCKKTFTDTDRAMLQRVNTYWFEFLRTGKPQANGNPMWQNHDKANDETMEFGETIVMRPDFMRHRLNEFIGFLKTMERILPR